MDPRGESCRGIRWKQTARFLRKPREQLIGKDVFGAFPEAKGSIFEENFREAMEKRVIASFEAFYEPLQSWFECRCCPSPEGISVLFTDTTEKKRREEERSIYREMVRNANSAIIRWKKDEMITVHKQGNER